MQSGESGGKAERDQLLAFSQIQAQNSTILCTDLFMGMAMGKAETRKAETLKLLPANFGLQSDLVSWQDGGMANDAKNKRIRRRWRWNIWVDSEVKFHASLVRQNVR
jgi:hypothetical protein